MPDAVLSINLHAMPLNFDEWQKITAGFTAAQEGVLLRAVRVAWQSGHRGAPVATLPDDDVALGRMLGGRDHLDVVRRLFVSSAEQPGVLAWPWLTHTYREALARYQRRKLAGVESGQTRRRRARDRGSVGRDVEQCSNNVRALREQPKPNPVGVGLSDQPPTGEAVPAPAVGGRAAPPDEPPRYAALVTPEQCQAFRASHPADVVTLEQDADAAMDRINPEWRVLPRRFGQQVRDDLLREQLARRILNTGGPHAS